MTEELDQTRRASGPERVPRDFEHGNCEPAGLVQPAVAVDNQELVPVRTAVRVSARDWAAVAFLCLVTAALSVEAVFFLPMRIRSVPVPLSVLPVAAMVAVAPRAAYRLTGRMSAAVAPLICWFVTTAWLGLTRSGLYAGVPLVITGWRFLLLLGVGALAGASSVGLLWGDHLRVADNLRAGGASASTDQP